MNKKLFLVLMLIVITGCGGGMFTSDKPTTVNESYSTPWGNVTITKDAFIFGGDFPSDIVIPDIDGMRGTAFVVSFFSPSGVIAIDLDSEPLSLSSEFAGLISPAGTGMPNQLFVLNTERAFLLTSSHIVDFNPTSGDVNTTFDLSGKYTLNDYMLISSEYDIDGNGIKEKMLKTINMSFPAGLAAVKNKLFVTMSNYISPIMPAIAAPGLVRIFDISGGALSESGRAIVTTDFNPTGVTPLPDGRITVTVSGVSDLWGGASHPLTDSSIDIIDPETETIVGNIPIGPAALSFQELAVTSDGTRAFIGSASYGEAYKFDFEGMTASATHENPITLTGNIEGSDYLSSQALSYDDKYLFVASFDNSSIYPVDIGTNPPVPLPDVFSEPFVLGFPKGVTAENPTGTNTGVGAIAIRPGTPGVDYAGPDIFALTGSPGTLVTINTHGNRRGNILQIKKMEIVPNYMEIDPAGGTIQAYLTIEFSDGTTENATGSFVNPYSGYPTTVNWTSSNTVIATIDRNGRVTPKSAGETIIEATVGQSSAEARLVIRAAEASLADKDVPEEEEAKEETENSGGENGGGGSNSPYTPDVVIYMNFYIGEIRLVRPVYGFYIPGENPAETPPETPQENLPEILTEAPAGTDPFADRVVDFKPGASAGFGADKMPDIVLGPPEGRGSMVQGFDVISLGSGGEIILEMTDFIIADGEGPDFTVFENAFIISGTTDPYSEPGIVSVSNDGENFFAFHCYILNPPFYPGCAGITPVFSNTSNGTDPLDPAVSGGDQFDLADVGLSSARFIKIVDGKTDKGIAPVQGFDLDAIAVLNGYLADDMQTQPQ